MLEREKAKDAGEPEAKLAKVEEFKSAVPLPEVYVLSACWLCVQCVTKTAVLTGAMKWSRR